MRICLRLHLMLIGSLMCAATAPSALADGKPAAKPSPLLPAYQQECGACHLAYPPGMLPVVSWQSIMENLPRHFGSDASLDDATAKKLSAWLATQGGRYKRVNTPPPENRISRSAWFIRKHDEVPASVWTQPSVKSAANCAACHPRASQGDFNEHAVRIPR